MFSEIYIMYSIIAFMFFYLAIDREKLVFSIMGMVMFFSLALIGLNVEPLYMTGTRTALAQPESNILLFLNFGFGLLSLLYSVWLYLYEMKKGLEGEPPVFRPT